MPLANPKACLKCGGAINEPDNRSFYHAACDPRPAQAAIVDKLRSQEPYRQLYQLTAWKFRTRPFILARDPICKICNRAPSDTVDHVIDHKGNIQLFFNPRNLRGVCKACHDAKEEPTRPTALQISAARAAQAVDNPPDRLPVSAEHLELPDGTEACKREYGRMYRKQGDHWLLIPKEFIPQEVQ